MSIRLLALMLILAAVLSLGFSVFELNQTMVHAQLLYELERERQECDRAIQQFMDGSDYLTAQVQQFAVKGKRAYMDAYWTEVYETRSRDKAVEAILNIPITHGEREMALAGKQESDALIGGEIWAMRMVCDSEGIKDMPADVAAYQPDAQDQAMTAAQKREAAMTYLFGPDYSTVKNVIRGNVIAFRNEIANRYGEAAIDALTRTKDTSVYMVAGIVLFFVFLAWALWSFARQVVVPLIGFSNDLRGYETGRRMALKEDGAQEIRQFAHIFNDLYARLDLNAKRLERLSYVDYLTDVPNRASITEYTDALIQKGEAPLGVLIVDIDNFKLFNDTYGHTLGDQVLRKVAKAVSAAQPEEDGISGRICGEEFVVVTRNADEEKLEKIARAALENVRAITAKDVDLAQDGAFHVTVSIGGMLWRGEKPADFIWLLSRADKALYASKATGKDRYTFFS